MKSTYEKGLEGEQLARSYLEKKGYCLVKARYKTPEGEIDLIMEKGSQVVFIEVKYRPKGMKGEGVWSITNKKKKRFLLAVENYLLTQNLHHRDVRIDVVEISKDEIWHIENAFSA